MFPQAQLNDAVGMVKVSVGTLAPPAAEKTEVTVKKEATRKVTASLGG